jgi:branched-chain amino acid transport system ATP-binding protein
VVAEETTTRGAEAPPLLEVRELGIAFRGVRALHDVTFDVPAGGVTAVIGPNGAGKTTLFNCVTGLYRPTGSVALAGEPLDRLAAHERVAAGITRTFQTPTLIDDATVLENVLLGAHTRTSAGFWRSALRTRGAGREQREAAAGARTLLDALGLEGLHDASVGGLPHRHRRLVEAARALLARPRLLLLDEPAAGSTHAEAMDMLAAIGAQAEALRTTIVLVEHNVPLVMEVARHIVVLNFGEIICAGPPATVRADERVVDAYLGAAA